MILNEEIVIVFKAPEFTAGYHHTRTMPEKMGPEGSIQELEFRKSLNLPDFYVRPGRISEGPKKRYKFSATRFA